MTVIEGFGVLELLEEDLDVDADEEELEVSDVRKTLNDIAGKVTEMYQDWPEIKARMLRSDELERRVIRIEGKVQNLEDKRGIGSLFGGRRASTSSPPPVSARDLAEQYRLHTTDTGTFLLPPRKLEEIAETWQRLEIEREGVEKWRTRIAKRFVFWLGVVATVASGLAWVAIHFLHL